MTVSEEANARQGFHSFDSDLPWLPSMPATTSSLPIPNTSSNSRYIVSEDSVKNSPGELDHHSMHATPPRQLSSVEPASWHGPSRLNASGHRSSSLPSLSPSAHENNINLPHLDTILSSTSYAFVPYPSQFSRAAIPSMGTRLPPDSTLLTPLPGYQPPTLSPPHFPLDGYDVYDHHYNARPDTSHSSLGDRGSGDES